MINHGGWEEGDSFVHNNGDVGAWSDHGRCLYHSATGLYLVFHPANSDNSAGDHKPGIMYNLSTDWDTTNHNPAGQTTCENVRNGFGEGYYQRRVGNRATESFDYHETDGNRRSPMVPTQTSNEGWEGASDSNEPDGNERRENWTTTTNEKYHFTYNISVGTDYITAAKYNDHSTIGAAGLFAWEHLDEKFWTDGRVPYHMMTAGECGDGDYSQYYHQFDWHYSNNDVHQNNPHQNCGALDSDAASHYGRLNWDANDDSFFFTYTILEDSSSVNRPVAYCRTVIPNRRDEGANSGDTVTEGGRTYKFFKRAGGTRSQTLNWGYRWE